MNLLESPKGPGTLHRVSANKLPVKLPRSSGGPVGRVDKIVLAVDKRALGKREKYLNQW
jgi:hypothetical protein